MYLINKFWRVFCIRIPITHNTCSILLIHLAPGVLNSSMVSVRPENKKKHVKTLKQKYATKLHIWPGGPS